MAILDLQEAIDLIDVGRAEEAIPPLTAWAQQMPAHTAVYVVLARAYEANEQWEEAQGTWQHARFLMPNSPAVHEGLERVRAAMAEMEGGGEDRLIMDLDLQAELEATLEALFNPFTLPQQSEVTHEEEPPLKATEALAQVEAAMAAAEADAVDAEATAAVEATETFKAADALGQEAGPDETVTEDEYDDGTTSIYDEIDQLIEEKATRKQTDIKVPEDRPIEDVAEQEQAEQQVLNNALGEALEAIEAVETRGETAAEEEAVELADWQEFEAEPQEAPPSEDTTIDDLDRLISELEAARIVPQPDFENIPAPELEDEIDDVVSETLARIYASQKKYDEAARIYEQLAQQQPEEADKFRQLAAEMHAHTGGSGPQKSPEEG